MPLSRFKSVALVLMAVLSTACSTVSAKQYTDPFENTNRSVHAFNEGFDDAILTPVSKAYVAVTPDPLEKGVSNFFDNLGYPSVVINQFLQGKVGEGFEGIGRFGINSTLGLFGLFDVASDLGLEAKQEDFGQTFAAWGFGSGPYVVSPLIGGTTVRDGIGGIATIFTNPGTWIGESGAALSLFAGATIDTSAQLLDERELIPGDSYLFLRDSYMQRRQFLIADGAVVEDDPFLDDE
ncbi:MAG: VacJ family lipoprotein [Pseudomonadota bacterium]